jgi:hypothetical protein
MKNAYKILVGKPEGKRPLRRLGVDESKMLKIDLKETEWESVDWIQCSGLGPVPGSCELDDDFQVP